MTVRTHLLIFSVFLTISQSPTFARSREPLFLSPEARLRKLSLHIRGTTPEIEEYAELEKNKLDLTTFFQSKTKEYLQSPRHFAKMVSRLDSLFRLKLSAGLPESRALNLNQKEKDPTLNPGGETYNSLDFLFEKIAKENLSWDQLLINKNFDVQYPEPTLSFRTTDLAFFKPIAPELPEPQLQGNNIVGPITSASDKYEILKTQFNDQDMRLGGAVTTSRFLSRYSTTNLNKNRGRAAAIFRIFLCDDMRAVVEPKPEEEAELLENAFPKPNRADEDKHGTHAACMSCHFKLDPMGKAFVNYSTVVATETGKGALVFKRSDGTLVHQSGNGLGEVLKFITQQPEYAKCQVSHFWKWFVRGDQLPSEQELAKLTDKFNSLGRKTNDFIAYLVNTPEFYLHPSSVTSSVSLSEVKHLLQRCDECHVAEKIPSFVESPIGGADSSHREFLASISKKLDLKNNGINKKMPPKNSAWQPSQEELLLIKEWVRQGAKDYNNNPTVDEAFAKSLVENEHTRTSQGKFRDSYIRYVSTHDYFRLLMQKFPNVKFTQESDCDSLKDGTRALLGEPNASTGELAYQGPSPSFVKYYGTCLLQLIAQDTKQAGLKPKGFYRYFGGEAVTTLETAGKADLLQDPKKGNWDSLDRATQLAIVKNLVHQMIGPGIVKNEERFISQLNASILQSSKDKTVYGALGYLLFNIATQDEFLSY